MYFSVFLVSNGPPTDGKVTPDNAGVGGRDVKDTTTTNSVPDESSGKPDPGTPGGPKKPGTGEGGKGGATGDGGRSDGGTDVATGGGSKGTNVEPVPPPKPPKKPTTPKPNPNAGGPGTSGSKTDVSMVLLKIKGCCDFSGPFVHSVADISQPLYELAYILVIVGK